MKKVLIISFYFPPCGSSSTARNVGYAKHFTELGLRPTVLTVKESTYEKLPTVRVDRSYYEDLKKMNIVRTASFIPTRFIRLLFKLRLTRLLKVFFPIELHIFWLIPGLLRAVRIIREEKPDFILSTSLPNTPHFIALLASKITKVPWIADFQDPMAYRFGDIWFTRLTHSLICFLEKTILKNADGITTQSKTAAEILLENHGFLSADKVTEITNAYDTDVAAKRSAQKPLDKITIVHSGEFYADYGKISREQNKIKRLLTAPLQYTEYTHFKADLTPHSAKFLFTILYELFKSEPKLKKKIVLILNGYINPNDHILIEKLGLEEIVCLTGMTSYKESLKIINSADLLYLPLFWDCVRNRNYCIPGKVFPYIASLNPIFAPIQDGDTKDILVGSGLGISPSSKIMEEIVNTLKNTLEDLFAGKTNFCPNIEYINSFSRKSTAKKMNGFVKSIIYRND